jgi:hypothetical protein
MRSAWIRLLATASLMVVLVAGCADPWAEYEDSLYGALRVPGDESYAGHTELLGDVVRQFEDEDRKPPPGILAEYGFYLARLGRTDDARRYLSAEVAEYPESARFVAALTRIIEGHRAFQPGSEE